MPTKNQKTGTQGENIIQKKFNCPKCKKVKTFKRLPQNFKCADIICDFCGFLAQVKTTSSNNLDKIPDTILGAAWKVQKNRMDAGIYFPLYLILKNNKKYSVFYLSADLQIPEMFKSRKPLSAKATRAGWQGFTYDTRLVKDSIIRLK